MPGTEEGWYPDPENPDVMVPGDSLSEEDLAKAQAAAEVSESLDTGETLDASVLSTEPEVTDAPDAATTKKK